MLERVLGAAHLTSGEVRRRSCDALTEGCSCGSVRKLLKRCGSGGPHLQENGPSCSSSA